MVKFLFLDSPYPWQLGFQDPATPLIIGIIHFYNYLIFFLVGIGVFVLWILARALILFKNSQKSTDYQKVSTFSHSTPLEIVWTVVPAFLLVLIAGPSFALLYSFDESIAPDISIKVIGHQWFWSYEYSDVVHKKTGKTICFDSYIIAEEDLSFGQFRLLETDNRLRLPTKRHIRVLVSAADVLHSWAVPSLGIKIDACPGRLNQVSLYLLRCGTFYGQCSELCGVNHAFMPIVVEALDNKDYQTWAFTGVISENQASDVEKVPASDAEKVPASDAEKVPASDAEKVPASDAEKVPASDAEKVPDPNPNFILDPKLAEELSIATQEKDKSYKLTQQKFSTLYRDSTKYINSNCKDYPELESRGGSISIAPHEGSLVLDQDCSNARAFLSVVHDPNYKIFVTRESICKIFFETYRDTFHYNSKTSEYFHKNDVSCETVVHLLGGDPVVLEVLDLEEKACNIAKKIVEDASLEFFKHDEVYLSSRKNILGENYNYDGYFSKKQNKK